MDNKTIKKIKKLFPDLTDNQRIYIYKIYVAHVCILEMEGIEVTDGKIKAIMDTITFSVKSTLNLRAM